MSDIRYFPQYKNNSRELLLEDKSSNRMKVLATKYVIKTGRSDRSNHHNSIHENTHTQGDECRFGGMGKNVTYP